MLQKLSDSLTTIEGIGPKTANAFGNTGVNDLLDFIVNSPQYYHDMVDELASLEEVSDWQKMAFLMQVDVVSGPYAEALLSEGITSIVALSTKSEAELEFIFQAAKKKKVINKLPSTSEMGIMRGEALKMSSTLFLTGKVVNATKKPAAAKVEMGTIVSYTNTSGHFKIGGFKIPKPMIIHPDDGGAITFNDFTPQQSPNDTQTPDFLVG